MADFLNQIFQSTVPFDKSIELIRRNRNFKAVFGQDPKYHDIFQSQINSYLSTPAKRVNGFLLLQEYLLEIPKELFADHLKNWATFCLSYIEGATWNGKNVALSLMDKLLKIGYNDDNSRRKLSLHIVSSLVEYICRNNFILVKCYPPLVYNILYTCVRRYPASCGSKKNLINNLLVKHIYECSDGLETLASVLANIHYCPTPGLANSNSKNSWFDHFCTVLVNLNSILSRFKTWGVGFHDLTLTNKQLPQLLNTNERDNFTGQMKLQRSYTCLSLVICQMLQDTSSNGLAIPVSSILQLVSRALSVKLDTLYLRDPCLSLTTLSLQTDSLHILEKLIRICKKTLIPYSNFFNQSLLGILENSSSTPIDAQQQNLPVTSSDQSKISSMDLKILAYQIIAQWYSINGPNMYVDRDTGETLLKHFMVDMKLSEKHIELRNTKKEKNPIKIDSNPSSVPFLKHNLNSLHLNCLKACSMFIKNCFINLPAEPLSFFATFVLEEVLTLYRYSISSSFLYEKSETRKELISLIVLLCLESETIPLSVGLNVIEKALSIDTSTAVRDFCLESLRSLNGTINPCRILRLIEPASNLYSSLEVSQQITPETTRVDDVSHGDDRDEAGDEGERKNKDSVDEPMPESVEQLVSSVNVVEKSNGSKVESKLNGGDQPKSSPSKTTPKKYETAVVMVQEVVDLDKNIPPNENDDCIIFDSEANVREIELDSNDDRDDDLEILSFKTGGRSGVKRDENHRNDLDQSKKPKIVHEDSQSSSSRSLTIIEPSPKHIEISSSASTAAATIATSTNQQPENSSNDLDLDIFKHFVAD